MTITSTTSDSPALLGGEPLFPAGLPLVRPTIEDRPELTERIDAILRSGMLTNGPVVRELEGVVADRLGVPHVIALASCTSGLMLTLQALGADGPVVLPSFTFSASAHAVHWAGGTPHFAEVREDNLTLDPAAAEAVLERLDGRAKAMTATHVYGTPCDTDALQAVADRFGIPLVYDAAHGLGSIHEGTPVGNFGTAEVFSLSPTKVVVAGEGGLVTTRDEDLARTIRMGRDYGNPGNYDCQFPGLNARMSEVHAATALHSLARLDGHLERRNAMVNLFWSEVQGLSGLRGPAKQPGDVSTYKDLTVVVDEAAAGLTATELARALKAEGIDSRHYYDPPIHRQTAYAGLEPTDLPLTDRLAASVISPPLWSHMSDQDVVAVAEGFRRALENAEAVRAALTEDQ